MKLEKVTNVAVIMGVALFFLIVGRNELTRTRLTPNSPAEVMVGKTIKLPGVNFPQERSSLVLALSTTCHFCKESLPFYSSLSAKAQGQLNVVAVLPQPEAEAQTYVHDASISATQVISAELDTFGVSATPTLLLVDGKGKVQKVWVGLLNEKGQKEVLSTALPGSANTAALSLPN